MAASTSATAVFNTAPTTAAGRDLSEGIVPSGQASRRAYLRTLRSVVDSSDVILQILDARDPAGTRVSAAIEDAVLADPSRRMVLVLNKVDLVPPAAVSGWLRHLRRSRPTVAVRAATSGGKTIGRAAGRAEGGALDSSSAVGVEILLQLLKNYARTQSGGSKSTITVGVIGYPNVGKSSLINSLVRTRSASVSSRPGHTTTLQTVVLDRNVRLLDSPGVVFNDADGDSGGEVYLRNCVDTESVDDPVAGVEAMLRRVGNDVSSLMMVYEIPKFVPNDAMMFLSMVAKRLRKVLKGGVPDKKGAARAVLADWNSGKVPYFTPPPDEGSGADAHFVKSSAVILSEFSQEFDVEKMLTKYDNELMKSLEKDGKDEMDFVQFSCDPASEGTNNDIMENVVAKALLGQEDISDKEMDEEMSEGDDSDSGMEGDDENEDVQKKNIVPMTNKKLANAEDFNFASMM
mmetsp:Transcript_33183/g.76560  ORF Transcript_33183/g.76560 Transcript_33183/m.76560 type:complete len:460 (+) Transcript_33183:720-2099(+)